REGRAPPRRAAAGGSGCRSWPHRRSASPEARRRRGRPSRSGRACRVIIRGMSRWVAAAGALVVSLDSMMNIAFPAIAAAFAVPPARVRWVIICYVLTYAITSFVGGAVADRIGHVSVFRAGVALSVVAFVMGGAAPSFDWLLIARVVQGFAGGLIYGTAPALATFGAPPEARGRRLGFLSAAMGLR